VTLKQELHFGARALLRDNALGNYLLRSIRRHETLTAAELSTRQAQWLHQSLQWAIAKLPYYAHIDPRFTPAEAADVLRTHFPIIDKHTLLAEPSRLYPHGGRPRPWESVGKSSGTTGTPIAMFRSPRSVLLEMAFVKRQWEWSGFHDGMRRASLRGDHVTDLARTTPPFWFHNRYNQQLLISSRHLKAPFLPAITDELARFAPAMLQAYPSTAYMLAQYLERADRTLAIPRIFTSSEPLYDHQRELIERRLGGKVRDMYGMAERVAMATACEHGEMHINSDYSYVEIVDEQGRPTDGEGYVVGTTLFNAAMPLVRYRLSDRTRWKPGVCRCGRPFPMIEPVTGKYEDAIYGSDGAPVSPSVLTFAFKGVGRILKSQVAQVAPGRWEIRLVPDHGFDASDQQRLIDNIHQLVDAGIQINIRLMSDIAHTKAGKFRWVVNEGSFSEGNCV
jgi:phenylacetate-CoA ligase